LLWLTISFPQWLLLSFSHHLFFLSSLKKEKIAIAKEHLHRLCRAKGPEEGPRDFRNQVAYYLKGIPHTARTKVALTDATDEEVMVTLLDGFLDKMAARRQRTPVARYTNG